MTSLEGRKTRAIEPLESRRFLAATIVQGAPAELVDSDGSKVVINLQGPGSATADMINGRLALSSAGTTALSNLTLTVTGGDRRVITRSIRLGKIGNVNAPQVDLAGSISIGSANSLVVRFISYAELDLGWIGQLSANRIRSALLNADRIVQINVATDVADSRIMVAPANDTRLAIGSFIIRAALDDTSIFTLGDIGTISAAAMYDSNIMAGVRISETSTPTSLKFPMPDKREDDGLYDFTGLYRIGQVVASGKTANPIAFSNTLIGAYEIDSAMLYKIDGRNQGSSAFGVAAFRLGSLKRSFDSANASKNAIAEPNADFTVRQIEHPFVFVPIVPQAPILGVGTVGLWGNPLTGSGIGMPLRPGPVSTGGIYTGILRPIGGTSYSGSSIGGSLSLVDHYSGGGGTITFQQPPPFPGATIGSISNHPASEVFLSPEGQFQARDGSGAVIVSAVTLAALAAELFRQSSNSVKVEQVSGSSVVTLRTTSVSPIMNLQTDMLGKTWSVPLALNAGSGSLRIGNLGTFAGGIVPMLSYDSNSSPNLNDFVASQPSTAPPPSLSLTDVDSSLYNFGGNYGVPNLEHLKLGLTDRGLSTHVFDRPLTLMNNTPMHAGVVIGALKQKDIALTTDLRFSTGDNSATSLNQLLNIVTSHPTASRRRAAKWVQSTDKTVVIYGLPDGGTAKIELFDQTILNATGGIQAIPTAADLKQSLTQNGIGFQP